MINLDHLGSIFKELISALAPAQFDQSLYCLHEARALKYQSREQHMSLVMRKPAFCICENKDADQLRGNREADQHLCFRYTDSTIPLLPKSEISSL